jgi:hypothetical protein
VYTYYEGKDGGSVLKDIRLSRGAPLLKTLRQLSLKNSSHEVDGAQIFEAVS